MKKNVETTEERVPAPDVLVEVKSGDARKAKLDYLNSKFPEFVHVYQSSDVTDWELKQKQQEFVRNDSGQIYHHMADPIVRMPRKVVEDDRKRQSEMAKAQVERFVKPENSTAYRNPKKSSNVIKKTKGG